MSEHLPYGRQWLDDDDVAAVAEVLRSDFLTTGPAVPAFEHALCDATGAAHAVALNSGTSALHAMYFAAGIGRGDEIVTSPLTFAATVNAALYLGAGVRFVDIEADTGNIDPELAEGAITERTKAIVAIDYAGHPAEYDALRAAADRRGVVLLADAAHSLGATYQGRAVGTLADATEFSFHPVKPITTGEGGAVVTDRDDIAAAARRFRTHGITREPHELSAQGEGGWWYEQHDLGFNYRLTDVQAALGSSQLRKLARFIARRREIAAAYDEGLAGLPGIDLPGRRAHVAPGWHLYVIRTHDPEDRPLLFERLRAAGLGVQVHYIPVYWHPYHADRGYARGACVEAETFYRCAISLPIFPRMSDGDVERVIDTLHRTTADLA
jgi:UDP-4-amino-4,6-dideoxy-N-acetyl-beta-L-altrosamine transaminase